MPHTVFVTSIAGGVAPMSRAVVASRDGVAVSYTHLTLPTKA